MNEFLGMPEVASAHGPALDALNAYIHWLMLAMFIGWGLLFIFMLVRFRQKKNPKADYGGLESHMPKYAEWAIVAAEAVLLIGFSIPLWSDRVDDFPAEEDATVVRVVAQQFAWNIHYAGNDGVFGMARPELVDEQTNPLGLDPEDPYGKDDVTTINQLRLPVDKPAIVHLSSKDVIHSFALYEMRVKQDAIPGLNIPVWFTPNVTTEAMRERTGNPDFGYEIACAQLCGNSHYSMRGFLTVMEQDTFDDWLEGESTANASADEGDAFWQ